MPDTTVRVEYIGAVQNFSEVTITGNQQVWRIGSSAFVETSRASQLVASGKFRSLANDPAMLPANQAKVGASPSDQGAVISGGGLNIAVSDYESVRSMISTAMDRGETVTYIVAGDSTRNNAYNQMPDYYNTQLAKAGIVYVNNAQSGQSGRDWGQNIDQNTVAQAIAASGPQGKNTVLEFCFGINDTAIGTPSDADIEGWLRYGLAQYAAACPLAKIVLCSPVYQVATAWNPRLLGIYQRMSDDLNYPLINVQALTSTMYGNPSWYYDGTHPNKWGAARIVNYILDKLLPADIRTLVTMSESARTSPAVPSSANLAGAVVSGKYWNPSSGADGTNANWRRLPEIAVTELFVLRWKTGGNDSYVCFMDSSGVFKATAYSAAPDANGWRKVMIPVGAAYARINLASNGATYDALGETPDVRYESPATMTQINAGQVVRFPSAA